MLRRIACLVAPLAFTIGSAFAQSDITPELFARWAKYGDIERVQTALEENPNLLKQANEKKLDMLTKVAQKGELAKIKFLVELGANPNHCCQNGDDPLLEAAGSGHYDVVVYLLEVGAKLDNPDRTANGTYDSPLHNACFSGFYRCALALLDAGAAIEKGGKRNGANEPPLHAAMNLHLENDAATTLLLLERGASTKTFEFGIMTRASKVASPAVLEYLVHAGHDPHALKIRYAVNDNQHDVICAMLELGVEPDQEAVKSFKRSKDSETRKLLGQRKRLRQAYLQRDGVPKYYGPQAQVSKYVTWKLENVREPVRGAFIKANDNHVLIKLPSGGTRTLVIADLAPNSRFYVEARQPRVFHDVENRPLEAAFRNLWGGKVALVTAAGRRVEVPLSRLSTKDVAWLKMVAPLKFVRKPN